MKRIVILDEDSTRTAFREIRFQKELSRHPAIVDFVTAVIKNPNQTRHGRAEYLLLTEFCSGGPLVEFIKKGPVVPENVLKIFYSVCSAVKYMHDRPHPITHRGITVDNLAFDAEGYVKLSNFESATIET